MADKNIKIDNSNGGVVNIYYGDENDAKTDNKSASIKMASVDKYSSPLQADVDLSPWGETMYKVSLLVKNVLIGQTLQNNYLFFNDLNNAKKVFSEIVDLMKQFKDKAEIGLVHSAILSQDIRNSMMKFKSELSPPESESIIARFPNLGPSPAIPDGLVIHPVHDHFPSHNEIVKQASNSNSLIKIAQSIEENLKYNFDRNCILKICQLTLPENNDSKNVEILKRKALTSIRPIISNFKNKSDEWLTSWIKSNSSSIDACITSIYAIAMEKEADIQEPETIDLNIYDYFIFDADRTLWDSTVPAAETIPPYEFFTKNRELNGDCVLDSAGNRINLKNGIRHALENLKTKGKILGLISKSEKLGIPYEDQPVLHLLKKFGILPLFDSPIAICEDLPKSIFIPKDVNEKHVLFIDDSNKNLIDVSNNTGADVLDAKEIEASSKLNKKAQTNETYENFDYSWLVQPDISGNYWNAAYHPSRFSEQDPNNVRMLLRIYSEFNTPEDWVSQKDENVLGAWWNKYRPDGWDSPVQFLLAKQQELFNQEAYAKNESWYKTAMKVMGEECELIDSKSVDCVIYELYKGLYSGSGMIRIFDEDAMEVVDLRKMPDFNKALETFNSTIKILSDSNNWYKIAKGREYIPSSERPEKPKDGKEYELDHKKSQYRFKNKDKANKKENLQWIEKDKHKEKSKKEGDFSYGGENRHKKLKEKGKANYSKYQSDTAKEKMKQEKDKLGEKGFSDLQRSRVQKRWDKADSISWYKVAQQNYESPSVEQQLFNKLTIDDVKKNWYKIAQNNYIQQPDFFNTPEELERMNRTGNLIAAIKNSLENLGDPDSPLLSDEPNDPTENPGWEDMVRESFDSSGYGSDEEDDSRNQWYFIANQREEDVGNFFEESINAINTALDVHISYIRQEIENYRQNPIQEGDEIASIIEVYETSEIPFLEGIKTNINSAFESYDNLNFYIGSGSRDSQQQLISLFLEINRILESYYAYKNANNYVNFEHNIAIGTDASEYFPQNLKSLIEAMDAWSDFEDYIYEQHKDDFEQSEIENEWEYHREKIREFLEDLYIPEEIQDLYGNSEKIEELHIGFLNKFNFSDLEDLDKNIKDHSINLSNEADELSYKDIFNNISRIKNYSLFDEETFRNVILNPEIGGYDEDLRKNKYADPELGLVLKFIEDNKKFQTMEVELPPLPDINEQENLEQPVAQAYRGDSLAGAPVIKKQLDKLIWNMKSKNDFSDPDSIVPTLVSTGAEIDTRTRAAWIGSNLPKFLEDYKQQQPVVYTRGIEESLSPSVDLEKVMGGPKVLRQWANHRVFNLGETLHDALYYLFDKKAQDQPPGLAKFLNLVVNSSKEDIVNYINNRKAALEQGYPDTPKGINQYSTDRILAMVNDPNAQGGFVPILVQHGYDDDDIKEFLETVKISPEAKIPSGVWTIGDYTFRVLEKNDPTGAVLGNIISCCQKINGVGEDCVYDGYENPKSGFMTVYDKSGKMIAMSYIKLGNSNSLYLDNIETVDRVSHDSKLRQAYLDWARRVKEEREYSAIYAGCGYTDMRFNTQKHKININSEFSSNNEDEDSTDVYTDLKSGAFRIAKKNLKDFYVMAGDIKTAKSQIIELIKQEAQDLFGDELVYINGIRFYAERYIRYNKITPEVFYANQWAKIKSNVENYISQEKSLEGPLKEEAITELGFPSPKDYVDGDGNVIVQQGKEIDENDLRFLLNLGYTKDLGITEINNKSVDEYYIAYLDDDPDIKAFGETPQEAEAFLDDHLRNEAYKNIIQFLKQAQSNSWYKLAQKEELFPIEENEESDLFEKIEYGEFPDEIYLLKYLQDSRIPFEKITFDNGRSVIKIEYNKIYIIENEEYITEAHEWIDNLDEDELYAMYPNYKKDPLEDVGGILYHGTSSKNLASIMKNGLDPRDETRGISNRNFGSGIFTSSNEESVKIYGDVIIAIDVATMIRDGFNPDVTVETGVEENELRYAVAHKLDLYDYYRDDNSSEGIFDDTVIFRDSIPPKYLKIVE